MDHQNAAFFGGEVQLGFPGHFINEDHSPLVSAKVGGLSDWLVPCDQTILCSCGARMCLIFQVYAPLKFSRTLYVFACRKQECNGITAFSMVSTKYVEPSVVETKVSIEPAKQTTGTEDWGTETVEALPKGGAATVKAPTNDDDDLEALLQARAAKTTQKAAANTQQQKSGKGKGKGKAAAMSVVVHTKETLDSKVAAVAEKPKAAAVVEVKKEDCLTPWEVVWDDAKNCGQTIDLSKEERLLRQYRETEGQMEVPGEDEEDEPFAEEAYEAEEGLAHERTKQTTNKKISTKRKQKTFLCRRSCMAQVH